jgi:hypothetical protein
MIFFTQFEVLPKPSEENATPSEDPGQVAFSLRDPKMILKLYQRDDYIKEDGSEINKKIIVRSVCVLISSHHVFT